MSTRVVACPVCRSVKFWLRHDEQTGKTDVLCDGCGRVLVTMEQREEAPTP